jgi:hypothetical protein
VQVDTIDPLPDGQPGNPAAIYAAAIRATWPAFGHDMVLNSVRLPARA